MVKTIMWDKGPDYTFERVKTAGLSYFELSQVDMTDEYIDQVLEASAKHGVTVMSTSLNYKPLFGPRALMLRKIWTVLLQPINVWELHM